MRGPAEVLDVDEDTARSLAIAHNEARRQLTPEQIKELREQQKRIYKDLRKEKPQTEAAAAVGVAQPTASHWDEEESNIQTNNALPDGRISIPKDQRPKILERVDAGESHAAIAADYGTTKQRIGQIVQQERKRKEAREVTVHPVMRGTASGFCRNGRAADRIQARAIRRCGELMKHVDGRGEHRKSEGDHTFSRRQLAEEAGMSRHQQIQATRVANVPEADFNAAVESGAGRGAVLRHCLGCASSSQRPAPSAAAGS